MHATEQHLNAACMCMATKDFREALEFVWPEWDMSADPQAALVAILDDGSLSELARIGDERPDGEASDIWSDSSWSDFIEAVRGQGPRPHVDATGRMLVPLTSGPILYGALELRTPSNLPMDDATVGRINESLSPVLVDLLTP